MAHHHHCECDHSHVQYCKTCKVVHCLDCKQEWQRPVSHWYPYYYTALGSSQTVTNLQTGQNIDMTPTITCAHGA